MSSAPQNILTLPRELRDQIYEYLYQDFEFMLSFRYSHRRFASLQATLENAPLLNVLLTCSQIHNEYRQRGCFKRLSISIEWRSFLYALSRTVPYNLNNGIKFDNALTLVHNATIFVSCYPHLRYDWKSIMHYVEALKRKAPKLSTIRVAFRTLLNPFDDNDLAGADEPASLIRRSETIPPPPSMLAGLPMRQIGQGFQIEYAWGVSYPDICHRLTQFGVYLYAQETAKNNWWHVNEVFQKWPASEYLESVLSTMPSDRAKEYRRYKHETWGWQEKRGDEIKSWNGLVDDMLGDSSLDLVQDGYAHWFDHGIENTH